jgi:hypothetical protein
MEKQTCEIVDRSEKIRELEIKKIDEEYEARKRREEINIQTRMQEESLYNLEFRTQVKLEELLE